MDKYRGYTVKEFLVDDHFLQWIEGGNQALNQQWEDWVSLHPESAEEIAQARLILKAIRFKKHSVSAEEIQLEWSKLQSGIQLSESRPREDARSPHWRQIWWKVAAVFLLVGLIIIGRQYQYPGMSADASDEHRVIAGPGKRLLLVLPDGSRVKLNSGSQVSYAKSFSDSQRTVTLEGEAFFEVRRDTLRPFVIHTGKLSTEVLGTSFAIRAYKGQPDIEVAVVEGKVRVNANRNDKKEIGAVLQKDEMATFDLKSEKIDISAFDPSEQILWKDGIIHFKKADFPSIIKKLERCYGVRFQLGRNVHIDKQWRYTGRFANKSLEYILQVISYPDRFQYKVNDDFVEIM
ncbi:FecR family protein [Dyadobacter tibetensis]|uniref:FecR family protein n=1 Tax=Dyadobacter tibetensis TaxID=1211851 RepID=UPI00046E657E|nr:FecR domain-containing protein [Dyadobacter tibetensis]